MKNNSRRFNCLVVLIFCIAFLVEGVCLGQNRKSNQNSAPAKKQVAKPSPTPDELGSLDGGDATQLVKDLENWDPMEWSWRQIRNHWLISLIVLAVLSGIGYLLWRFMWGGKLAPERVTTGRTANNEEITEWEYKPKTGMFYLGENHPIADFSTFKGEVGVPYEMRQQHIFIEAPTGSNKTTCFMVPQLVDDAQSRKVSTITFDRKAIEQFMTTGKIWNDLGHQVFYLSLWNPLRSMGFEPLFGASQAEVRALVEGHIIISPDPKDTTAHYRVLEQQVLEAIFKTLQRIGACQGPMNSPHCRYTEKHDYKAEEAKLPHIKRCFCRRHLCTLPAAADIINRGYDVIRTLINYYPDIAAYCPVMRDVKPTTQTTGMLNGLAGKMKYYLDDGPKQVLSRSDFRLDSITQPVLINKKQSAILYIDAPQDQGRSAAVFSSVMAQLIYQKINERRKIMVKNTLKDRDVKHLSLRMDEIGTFTIPDINNMLATIRDTNTGCVLLLQDQKQLAQFYDKLVPETIHSNSYCKIYTGTIAQERAENISKSIGNMMVSDRGYAYGSEGIIIPGEFERKKNFKQTEAPVLTPDAIEKFCRPRDRKIEDGYAIIDSDRRPFVVKKWAYFRTPKNQEMVDLTNDSAAWNTNQDLLNESQDEKKAARSIGEPKRFSPKTISWDLVPAVHDVIRKQLAENDNYIPLTSHQLKRINAKLRDLGKEEDQKYLENLCRKYLNKEFSQLSKRDGEEVMNVLDEMLRKADEAANTQRRSKEKIG